MMGEPVCWQDRLFYEFDLEEMVPDDHLLRRIDKILDLSWLRDEMKPHYSHLGCPPVYPELMMRILLVGYCYSIRSERRLCDEVSLRSSPRAYRLVSSPDSCPNIRSPIWVTPVAQRCPLRAQAVL